MNNRLARFIATGAGLGRLPMPGTMASAAPFLFWFFIATRLTSTPEVLLYLVLIIIVLWATVLYSRNQQYRDLPEIVGDEILACLLIIGSLPPVWYHYLSAFIIFRLLDIFKPFGIRKIEKIPGVWGIILDDLAAAAVTIIIVSFLPIL